MTLPDVPTVAESGVAGYEYTTWYPMLLPAAAPKAVVTKLNDAVGRALAGTEVRTRFAQQGVEPEPTTPAQLDGLLRSELARWEKITKAAGIRAQ